MPIDLKILIEQTKLHVNLKCYLQTLSRLLVVNFHCFSNWFSQEPSSVVYGDLTIRKGRELLQLYVFS